MELKQRTMLVKYQTTEGQRIEENKERNKELA